MKSESRWNKNSFGQKMIVTKETPEPFIWKNTLNQYLAASTVNLLMFAHGTTNGWMSPALSILSSKDTPLESGPLTNEVMSWIGSVNTVGGVIGTISLGFLVSLMGSKRAILLLAIPEVLFWFLIFIGSHYYYIIIARILIGISGGGIITSLVLYIAEIANDNIRGRLASSMSFFRTVGVLISFILGSKIDYFIVPCISLIFPLIFLIIFWMMPNTPQFHLQRGQTHKAEKALKFYKSYKGKEEVEDNAISKEIERLKIIASEQKTDDKINASDFLNRRALKGLAIGCALNSCTQFSANYTIINYAALIFERTGSSIDPDTSSIVLALALIIGSMITTYSADILGRKLLNVVSLAGSAFGLFSMSLYYFFYINDYNVASFGWVPVVSLSFVILISSAGIASLASVCGIECLPKKIRTPGHVLVCVWAHIITFICTKLFPILLDIVDLHGCMIIFGISSLFGVIFVAFVTEETSGKSLDDVGVEQTSTAKPISAR